MRSIACIAAGLIVLGFAVGCSTEASDDAMEHELINVGDDAAAVARARARLYADDLNALVAQRGELERNRDQMLRDAQSFQDKAARVWTDPALAERERAPHAKQYLTSAEQRNQQAERYRELMSSYDAQIAALEAKRQQQLREAEKYDQMKVTAPQ